MASEDLKGRKVLILVAEDFYFCSHRLPLGRALVEAGAETVVVTRLDRHGETIRAAGMRTEAFDIDRSGRNPLRDLATVARLVRLYRRERPDLVHHVALKPTLYGALAAWIAGVPAVVNALGGMGYVFISPGLFARIVRPLVRAAYRVLLNRPNARTILQNPDDMALFARRIGIRPELLALIRGAGVDLDRFRPAPEPPGPPVAVCVSRMLWDKGIGELVDAARQLRAAGVALTVRLVGPTDGNPAAIPQATLDAWAAEGAVEIAGPTDDVPGAYAAAHIAVLPSYREGLPKSLLEAAASGRAMVATDVPGCREVCRDGETGLLVPARESAPLAAALRRLAEDAPLRHRLAARARAVAEAEFGDAAMVRDTLALYRTLLAAVGRTR